MNPEIVKFVKSKNVFLKALVLLTLIVSLFFYFKTFFTVGVDFENTFLKKETVLSENHYTGSSRYGDMHILVKGVKNERPYAEIIFDLPNNINRKYTVNFKNAENWDQGIENIMDGNGEIVFEGEYVKDSLFLIDKNGKPVVEGIIRVLVNTQNPFNEEYFVPLKNVADLAGFWGETIRGRYDFLFLAALMLLVTLIDIMFPMFFFKVRYSLHTDNAEPSDFYLTMQKVSWYIYPLIVLGLMIAAIW